MVNKYLASLFKNEIFWRHRAEKDLYFTNKTSVTTWREFYRLSIFSFPNVDLSNVYDFFFSKATIPVDLDVKPQVLILMKTLTEKLTRCSAFDVFQLCADKTIGSRRFYSGFAIGIENALLGRFIPVFGENKLRESIFDLFSETFVENRKDIYKYVYLLIAVYILCEDAAFKAVWNGEILCHHIVLSDSIFDSFGLNPCSMRGCFYPPVKEGLCEVHFNIIHKREFTKTMNVKVGDLIKESINTSLTGVPMRIVSIERRCEYGQYKGNPLEIFARIELIDQDEVRRLRWSFLSNEWKFCHV